MLSLSFFSHIFVNRFHNFKILSFLLSLIHYMFKNNLVSSQNTVFEYSFLSIPKLLASFFQFRNDWPWNEFFIKLEVPIQNARKSCLMGFYTMVVLKIHIKQVLKLFLLFRDIFFFLSSIYLELNRLFKFKIQIILRSNVHLLIRLPMYF